MPVTRADRLAERRPGIEVTRSDRLDWALQKWVPLYGRPYRVRVVLRHPQSLRDGLPRITAAGFQEIRQARPQEVRRDLGQQVHFYDSRPFVPSAVNALQSYLAKLNYHRHT